MTPTTETTTAPVDPEPAPTPDPETDPGETPTRPQREAARYRTQLRETEVERDRLGEQLAVARVAAVEAQLTGKLAKHPEVFWRCATTEALEATLDEHGNIDTDRLAEVVAEVEDLLEPFGVKGAVGPYVPSEGTGSGRLESHGPTWAGALSPTP